MAKIEILGFEFNTELKLSELYKMTEKFKEKYGERPRNLLWLAITYLVSAELLALESGDDHEKP